MEMKAYIEGTVQIGDPTVPDQVIDVPVKATIPPEQAGVFVFDYAQPDVTAAVKINLASFLKWLGSNVGLPIALDSLPESLRILTIAVTKFHLDTNGDFAIDIYIGSMVEDRWMPEWKPVSSLNVVLVDFGMGVSNMAEILALSGLAVTSRTSGFSIAGVAPGLLAQPVSH